MNPLYLIAVLPFLFGFTFSPMSQSIDLGEKQKGTQFLLENDSDQKMAVELVVKERSMDEAGVETQTDTKDISIFPPQIIIPPGEKRTIRVTWNGAVPLETEKSYRVIAEQLGLKVDDKVKNKSGIQMLMKYVAALYVTPDDAESKVAILSHSSDGKELTLVVENSGNKHQILGEPVLGFEASNKKVQLKQDDLKGFAGENVLAKSKRTFKIKSSAMIPAGAKVSIKVND
jgi:fimbrial chaperone protein